MKKQILFSVALLAASATRASVDVPVMQESFMNATSTTIQGGYFAESYYISDEQCDLAGWEVKDTYVSERAAKFSAKTKTGYMISPTLPLTQDDAAITVAFRAQRWDTGTSSDDTDIEVIVLSEGVAMDSAIVSLAESTNVSNRNQDRFTVSFAGVPEGAKIKFSPTGTSVARLFLADVTVYESRESSTEAAIDVEQTYHHFANLMAGNDSETNYIYYNLHNCSGLEIIGEDGDAPYSFTLTDEGDGTISVDFTPTNAGDKEERYLLKAGDATRELIFTGKCKVYRPEVAEATNIGDNTFTANWKSDAGIDTFKVTVWKEETGRPVAEDLMITKYIEGKSNNRALEVFNGTGGLLNLDGYALRMETNGAGGLTSGEFLFPDIELEDGDTYTICNAQFTAVSSIADKSIGYQDGGYNNITVFTGDDAIGLFNSDGKLIDIIGYENMDQNDLVSGDFGADVSYYRKNTVAGGHDKFYPEEWDAYPMDYCENFGTHSLAESAPLRKIVATREVEGSATSADIADLEPGTTYFYSVQGISNGMKTHYSYAATVKTTGQSSGIETIDATEGAAKVYDIHGYEVDRAKMTRGLYIIDGKKVVVK